MKAWTACPMSIVFNKRLFCKLRDQALKHKTKLYFLWEMHNKYIEIYRKEGLIGYI